MSTKTIKLKELLEELYGDDYKRTYSVLKSFTEAKRVEFFDVALGKINDALSGEYTALGERIEGWLNDKADYLNSKLSYTDWITVATFIGNVANYASQLRILEVQLDAAGGGSKTEANYTIVAKYNSGMRFRAAELEFEIEG